jgi:branched-chain amino acid transport system permease protein
VSAQPVEIVLPHGKTAASQKILKRAALGALVAVACALPLFSSDYTLFQYCQVYSYAMALLGLNILTGYNGQISLGHGAFYAIGGYTTAIFIERWGIAYGWTLPVSGALCFVVGFLFGLPALRLAGTYLALATFALALALPQILKHFDTWTGGSQGIVVPKPDAPRGLPLNPDQWLYFLTLSILLLLILAAWNLLRGRVGRAIVAIRDHPIASEAMGIHNSLYKSFCFGLSACYTGLAGSLAALSIGFVSPDSFNVLLSITLLVGVVVGGLASVSGALLGAVFIEFMPNAALQISKAAPWAVYGASLILCMYVMPRGAVGLLETLWQRAIRRLS